MSAGYVYVCSAQLPLHPCVYNHLLVSVQYQRRDQVLGYEEPGMCEIVPGWVKASLYGVPQAGGAYRMVTFLLHQSNWPVQSLFMALYCKDNKCRHLETAKYF